MELPLPAEFVEHMQRMERAHNDVEAERAKRDPKTHKLSRVFDGKHGLNYHYIAVGRDGRKRRIRFCWSTHRNVAGYFLGWREIENKTRTTRDRWCARRMRKAVERIAERRAKAYTDARRVGKQITAG